MRRAATRRQARRRKLTLDDVPGAIRAGYPGFVEPCLATPRTTVPDHGRWIHEIKHDGYRAQAHVAPAKSAIYTRRGCRQSPDRVQTEHAVRLAGAARSLYPVELALVGACQKAEGDVGRAGVASRNRVQLRDSRSVVAGAGL